MRLGIAVSAVCLGFAPVCLSIAAAAPKVKKLTDLTCVAGQTVGFDGTNWECVNLPTGVLSGLEIRFAGVTLPADGKFRATCPEGKSVVGFGYDATSVAVPTIRLNRPAINAPQMDWVFQATPGDAWAFYWTCADADPAVAGE